MLSPRLPLSASLQAELEAERLAAAQARGSLGEAQAELVLQKQQLASLRSDRDQAELRRAQEVECKAKVQVRTSGSASKPVCEVKI